MQETIKKNQQLTAAPFQFATSQRDIAIQLGLSHIIAAGAALGLYCWMNQTRIQQPYPLLSALGIGCIVGLLCTLNFQYSLYLLELALSHLSHDRFTTNVDNYDYTKSITRRWPLIPLFAHLQETAQRVQQYATNERLTSDLRAQTLQQAGETAAQVERNRIARELHDSIKQQIFSISVSAAAAQAYWQSENSGDARAAVEDIQRSAKEAQVEMQALLQQLRPAPLENTSLVDALHVQAQAIGFRTGAQVHIEIGEMPANECLLPGTPEAIFRLVQEAFANIAKHARAQTIWLSLSRIEQALRVEIRDDGQGFALEQASGGMGLHNLRDRAQELHGQAEIASLPGKGTSVIINLPLLEALSSPEEEARQKYKLMRAIELSRRGYQLGESAAFLGMALTALAALFSIHWLAVVMGVLASIYGSASGSYYRIQVALDSGPNSKIALELKRQEYRALLNLVRLLGFSLWYGFHLLGLLNGVDGWWLLGVPLAVLSIVIQIARRRYYLDTEHYYNLLSLQELSWELERRRQSLTRSLTFWFIASAMGLLSAHSLFIAPFTPAKEAGSETAYAAALFFLVIGISLFVEYFQIQRWRQIRVKREQSTEASAQED